MDFLSSVKDTVVNGAKSALDSVVSSLGTGNRAVIVLGGKKSAVTGGDMLSAAEGLLGSDIVNLGTSADNAITVSLPFNPSSLKITAAAGGKRPIVDGDGKTKEAPLDPRIMVSFTVYVDEVNNADAFLFERVNLSGGVMGLAKSAYHLLSSQNYSVAEYVEGFIAALRNPDYNAISFQWASMEYTGTLNNLSAKYTMFNPSGVPIKAEITIRIQCVSTDNGYMREAWRIMYEDALDDLKDSNDSGLGINLSASSIVDRFLG